MGRSNQRRSDPAVKKARHYYFMARFGHVLLALLLLAASAGGVLWLNQNLAVRQWSVEAPEPIKGLIEARMQAMLDRSFMQTRPGLLRQQWLDQIADMQEVQIVRQLPHTLQITARARRPVALWQDSQNRVHLFDSRGTIYRLLARDESPDLPLLRLHQKQLPAAHKLLQLLAEQHKIEALSEISANSKYWRLYFSHGATWRLAQKNVKQQISAMVNLLSQPRWRQGEWSVDTRIQNRWFIRPAARGGVI
ncbi:MAG: hypothetical protein Q9M31_06500 [Mariprofundus sp.]|nr:hypothetical protein [Mariprofundus sp.]